VKPLFETEEEALEFYNKKLRELADRINIDPDYLPLVDDIFLEDFQQEEEIKSLINTINTLKHIINNRNNKDLRS
jgi:hypothetical protein